MAYRAKDGRAFGRRDQQRAYDERSSTKSEPVSVAKGIPSEEEPARSVTTNESGVPHDETNWGPGREDDRSSGEDDLSHMDIADVVREHGPAQSVTITHSGGSHEVTSNHGGRTHRASFPNAMTAHIHAGDASGLHPDMQGGRGANPEDEEYSIPGIRSRRS